MIKEQGSLRGDEKIMNDFICKTIELRHQLHSCAELSMQEHRTKEMLVRFLRENTHFTIYDFGSWFLCASGEDLPGEAVAFRAEMDALPIPETIDLPYSSRNPGVSHKCGHDGHAASLCGLALALKEKPVERPVYLVFQPGEEIGAGGFACAKYLEEIGIREVYGFHNLPGFPLGSIVTREGLTQPASEGLRLLFRGICSHASEPEQGINPAQAIAETLLYAQDAIRHFPHRGMALCTVVGMKAGTGDFGISAGDGELSFTLRGENEEEMKELEERIVAFAGDEAQKAGLRFEFEILDYFPETRNDPGALGKVKETADRLGKPRIDMEELWRASEDFGYYTKKIPGALFYVGAGEECPPLHTPGFDFRDAVIETAVDMMYHLAF